MKLSPEFHYEKPLSCLNFVPKQTTQAMLLRRVLFLNLILLSFGASAQLPWTEDFESGYVGFSISPAGSSFTDGSEDYLVITDGTTDIGSAMVYSGSTGSFISASDIDGDGESNPQVLTWSGISISGCTGLSFSIDAAEDDDGSNEDWDNSDFVHIDYRIDGGAYTPLIWFENDGAQYNSAPYVDANFDGTGDGAEVTSTYQTFSNAIAGAGSTIDIRITISLNAGDEDIALDNLTLTATSCGGPPPPTITAGSISGGPFTVDCTGTSDSGTFSFTTTGTFNAGNEFTAELTNGTVLGTVTASGSGPFADITLDIPSDLATGTYDVQITSSDPNAVSGTVSISVTQTGTCEPPHTTSVIINSCNTVCQEGQNELVFGNTGDYSVLVNETNFNFSYTNSPPTLQNYTDNLTNNATTTQELNNECPATFPFIDAYGTTIPPSSSWILANDDLCPTDALDWTGLCFSGPIYVIYTTDPTWSLSGNFSNTTSGIRPYQTSITTTSGQTFTIDYETDGSQYPDDDGVYATFDSNGGPATGYGDDDCIIQPVLLPVELASFTGMDVNGKNTFLWTTVSERNSSHFELLNSIDGENWLSVGSIPAAGYTESVMNYSFDHAPRPVINYYRLKQYDLDGSYLIYTKTITIDNREEQKEVVGYYNVLGQEITKETPGVQIILFSDGTTVKTFK